MGSTKESAKRGEGGVEADAEEERKKETKPKGNRPGKRIQATSRSGSLTFHVPSTTLWKLT
jgi:hypothetical protein